MATGDLICMQTIKPLSVNKVWQGKRFKTPDYKEYEEALFLLLPKKESGLIWTEGKLSVYLEWGFSSKNADIDNPIKPYLDILQKFYGFNDKQIYELRVVKRDVQKGAEYVGFDIKKYEE